MATGTVKSTKVTPTAKVAAQPSTNQTANTVTAALVPATEGGQVLAIKFAKPKAEKVKSDRPFCSHVDGKGKRCQLRVLVDREFCVNHVPAEERLTAEEATALLTLLNGLDDAQKVRMLARTIGWFKVKQLVGGTPEGDLVLNELVG